MEMQWYYAKGDEQFGPVSMGELQQLAASGRLLPEDLVWRDGMADWIPAGGVQELFAAQPAPPPWAASAATAPPQPEVADDDPLGFLAGSTPSAAAPPAAPAPPTASAPPPPAFPSPAWSEGSPGSEVPPPAAPPAVTGKDPKRKAYLALILSVFSAGMCCAPVGLAGALLGFMAFDGIKKSRGKEGKTESLVAMVLGVLPTPLWILILLIALWVNSCSSSATQTGGPSKPAATKTAPRGR